MARPSQLRTLATITDALQDARVDCRVTAIGDQDHREELTVELELEIDEAGAFVLDEKRDGGRGGDEDETVAEALADLEDQLDALQATVDELVEPERGIPAVADLLANGGGQTDHDREPADTDSDSAAGESDQGQEAPDEGGDGKSDAGEETGVATVEGLTPARRETLALIAELGESPSSEIVDASDTDDAARKHTQWLEERGLVEHRPDPDDGRRYLYSLSDAGASLLAGAGDEEADEEQTDAGDEEAGEKNDDEENDNEESDEEGDATAGSDPEPDQDDSTSDSGGGGAEVTAEDETAGRGGTGFRWSEDSTPDESREEVEQVLDDSASVPEVAEALDCGTERVLRVLGYYNLDEEHLLDGATDYEEVREASDEVHIEQATNGDGGDSDGDGDGDGSGATDFDADDPFADLWLDEGTFWAAVEEADQVHRLRSKLGWLEDEDGSLHDLLEATGAAAEFEGGGDDGNDDAEEVEIA